MTRIGEISHRSLLGRELGSDYEHMAHLCAARATGGGFSLTGRGHWQSAARDEALERHPNTLVIFEITDGATKHLHDHIKVNEYLSYI